MKVHTPLIAWHNRERVSSADFQPVPYPNGQCRLATAGDDKHVIVSSFYLPIYNEVLYNRYYEVLQTKSP